MLIACFFHLLEKNRKNLKSLRTKFLLLTFNKFQETKRFPSTRKEVSLTEAGRWITRTREMKVNGN